MANETVSKEKRLDNKDEVVNKINDFLVDEFEVDASEITPEANLKDTLDLDSLDYVDLVVFVEENFKVKLTAEDFQTVVTFDDFYNLILKKIND